MCVRVCVCVSVTQKMQILSLSLMVTHTHLSLIFKVLRSLDAIPTNSIVFQENATGNLHVMSNFN